MQSGLQRDIEEAQWGDHLCSICENEEERRTVLRPFLRGGFQQNQRVLYIADSGTADQVMDDLDEAGLDVSGRRENGDLCVLTSRETYLRGEQFDPDGMLQLLREQLDASREEGYAGLRAVGEMEWALAGKPGSEKIIEYEAGLNNRLADRKCITLCQYDRRSFSDSILLDVLRTHPKAIVGGEKYENAFYMPPEELLAEDSGTAQYERWCKSLEVCKRRKNGLRRARDRSQTYFDEAGCMMVCLDSAGNVSRINRAGVEMLGYEKEEIVGRQWIENFVPEQWHSSVRETWRSLVNEDEGRVKHFENPVVTRDGEWRHCVWDNTVLRDANGSVNEVICSGIDITERKKAVKKLRKSEERYRDFFRTSRDATFITTRDGEWVDLNEAAVELLGYDSREELRQVPVSSLYADPAYRDEHLRLIEEKGYLEAHPVSLRRKDGSVVETRFTSVPISDDDGEIWGYQGTIRDVTERNRMERRLRESEQLFRNLFEHATMGVAQVDLDGKLLRVNDRLCSILGYSRDELEGLTFQDITHPDDLEEEMEQVRELRSGRKRQYSMEKRYICADGDTVWALLSVGVVQDDEGSPNYLVGMVKDITERREAERELERSEHFLRSTIDAFPSHVAVLDENGTILRVNESWRRFGDANGLGWDDYGVGRNYLDVIRQASGESLQGAGEALTGLEELLEGSREHLQVQYPCHSADQERWFIMDAAPFETEAGKRAVIVHTDITEREKAQEALRASRERLRRTVEHAPLPIMIHCEDGEVLTVNKVWRNITGYSSGDIPTVDAWTEKAYGTAKNDVKAHVRRLYEADGRVEEGEFEIMCRDGSKRVWAFSSAPLGEDRDGRRMVVSMAMDVTARKMARQRLLHLNRLLRGVRRVGQLIVQHNDLETLSEEVCLNLLDAGSYAGSAIALLDPDTERIRPVARGGISGRDEDWEITPEGEGEGPECMKHVVSSGEMAFYGPGQACKHCAYACGGGDYVCAAVAIKSDGEVVGMLQVIMEEERELDPREKELLTGVALDLGLARDKILTENALRHSERRLGTMFDNLPGMAYRCGKGEGWLMEHCSEGSVELLGYTPEELAPNGEVTYEELIHPDDRQTVRDRVQEAVSNDRSFELEYRVITREGKQKWVWERGRPVWEDGDEPVMLEGIISDITDRKETKQQLEKTNQQLQESLTRLQSMEKRLIAQERRRALTKLASGVAHDFNNALGIIRGSVNLMLEKPEKMQDAESVERYFRRIDTAAAEAAETVKRMRKFYKPQEQSSTEPLDLNACVEEAIDTTTSHWKDETRARGAPVHVEKDLNSIPPVEGNEAEIHELLTNLILNAVDAMPEGGTLTFATRKEGGDTVALDVSDTGEGMSEEVCNQCFNPFFTTKKSTGSGLGLSTVQGIVRRHEGSISVDSSPGEGTTFHIRLPVADGGPDGVQKRAPAGTSETNGTFTPLHILVIEDDPNQRSILRESLDSRGHTVDTAENGAQGLEKFWKRNYDLVMTDRAMAEMSGDEVAARIKDEDSTQVIMLTGFGDMMDAAGQKPDDVDLLLSKPVTPKELREAIHGLMGGTDGG